MKAGTGVMFAVLSVGLTLSTGPAFAASPQSEGYRKLSGKEIPKAFVGKTLSDGTHFSMHYRPNGTIDGTSMAKKVTSKWAVKNDALCESDSFGETCYVVWKKGKNVRMLFGKSDLSVDGTLQ